MRVLVFGAGGQMATALAHVGKGAGVDVILCGRSRCDLQNASSLDRAIDSARPDIVVNAAAYTSVDAAEADAPAAFAINTEGAGIAAAAAQRAGLCFIHLSTDYVFDGEKHAPYVETDKPNPHGVYATSKYQGEGAVMAENSRHVILRTSWIFSAVGRNFVRTMLRLAGDRDVISVVDDQRGNPTFADDLAAGILTIAQQKDRVFGLFHLAGTGEATWYDLACEVFSNAKMLGGPVVRVQAIKSQGYPTPAPRPSDSRLDCNKITGVYGLRLPHWRDGLARCMREISDKGWIFI